MKKLLFTGLMVINIFLIAGEKQGPEEIYNYLDIFADDEQLPKVPVLDCTLINKMPQEQFEDLVKRTFDETDMVFDVAGELVLLQQDDFNRFYKLLQRIDACRSITSITAEYTKDKFKEMSEAAFNKWSLDAQKKEQKYNQFFKNYKTNRQNLLNEFGDVITPFERFIVKEDVVSYLRSMRSKK